MPYMLMPLPKSQEIPVLFIEVSGDILLLLEVPVISASDSSFGMGHVFAPFIAILPAPLGALFLLIHC